MKEKLYVLVRKDLPKNYQAVQAGHAVAEYLLKNPKTKWNNGTLVYLQVQDEYELKKWMSKINNSICFREPDINNEITSIAVLSTGEIFSNLKLL